MERNTFTKLNKLAEISLNLANLIDREAEENGDCIESVYLKGLGYGYRAFGSYVREGVKAIADIQEMYSDARSQEGLAKIGEEQAMQFLEDIFGDREIYTVNEDYKNRLKALVIQIDKEHEEEWERLENKQKDQTE